MCLNAENIKIMSTELNDKLIFAGVKNEMQNQSAISSSHHLD